MTNPILKQITKFTADQFIEAGTVNDAFRRTAGREGMQHFVDGRNTLVRLGGYADHVAAITPAIAEAMAVLGPVAGREKIASALRWAVLADVYRDDLSTEQYDALTTPFTEVVDLVAA